MRASKYLFQSIFLLLLSATLVSADGNANSKRTVISENAATEKSKIHWVSYDTGLVVAKKESKHVFLNFTTSWCSWCKKMEKDTFSKEDFIKLMNENFVAVKVYGDSNKELNIEGFKITEKNLAKREYRIRGYPTYCFLKSDGTNLGCFSGYRPKDAMMKYLNYVKDEKYDTTKIETSKKK
ncbi:MAG: hypothetical protein DRP47_04710 [Candidatus Zixiibacteriota bacterium]|nr:MAG: hypothetical protein DRP47_04710 [candidate division Zixibacteria bacterium]